jgi:putative intracellular protease/amidase
MAIALFVLAAAIVALTAVLVLALLRAEPVLKGREVTINTRRPDDQAIRGVLVREGKRWLELRDAAYLTAGEPLPIDGAVHVPADHIAFVQES